MAEERGNWLENLKVGDEVAIVPRSPHWDTTFGVVEKVTPSRQFVVSGGQRFNARGDEIGTKQPWARRRLHQVTHTIKERVERKALIETINRAEWAKLDTAKLREIASRL